MVGLTSYSSSEAAIKEHTFRGSRLASINMGDDADISCILETRILLVRPCGIAGCCIVSPLTS